MNRKALWLYLVVSVAWGVPYALIRLALTGFDPASIVLARVAIGALVLIPLAAKRGALASALKHWPYVLAFAVIEMAGPWILLTTAEQHISSSLASLLISTVPFFGVPLAYLTGDKSVLQPKAIAGLALGFCGVLALVGIDALSNSVSPVWIGVMLLAALGYAIAPVIVDHKLGEASSTAVAGVSMAMVAVIYAIPGGIGFAGVGAHPAPISAWLALVGLGLISTALSFTSFFELIALVGSARATTIVYPNLAVAFLVGIVFLKEPITTGFLIGVPMVIAGSWLATRRKAVS
jgi:drug/metabolite transporter (DMT)-like permease